MQQPHSTPSIEQTVESLIQRKLYWLAFERVEDALQADSKNVALQVMKADICREMLDFHAARPLYEQLVKTRPEDLRLLHCLAQTLVGCGEPESALEIGRCMVERAPEENRPAMTSRMIDMLIRTHHQEEARAMFEQVKPAGELPGHLQVVEAQLLLQEKRTEDAAVGFRRYIDFLLDSDDPNIQNEQVSHAWFLLAKVLDKIGDFDGAWAAADEGHAPYKGWDPAGQIADFDRVRELMNRPLLRSLAHAQADFEWTPLFIVGMPRSGTTLLEQILSMHDDVSNGGEMCISSQMIEQAAGLTDSYHPFPELVLDLRTEDCDALGQMYMEACRPFAQGSQIASNKALNLQSQLGFLSLTLPHAKAIMLYRHPLDNAVSCHCNNLVTLGHRFTTDMGTFGKIWVARRKMQEYWLEQLDIPMLELHYESMVKNQDDETRRLLDFIDVKWEPRCLDFHESTQIARTISWDQVNRKMYTTSDGRWKNYEKYLGPVIDEVQEYL